MPKDQILDDFLNSIIGIEEDILNDFDDDIEKIEDSYNAFLADNDEKPILDALKYIAENNI